MRTRLNGWLSVPLFEAVRDAAKKFLDGVVR